ncbi:MAG: biotin transporter BioY [Clostridia bacterium]|nr:biotin transporter BioY [Clostridia bacterium]
MSKLSTIDIVRVALMCAVMVLCSWIAIPTAVPFTLQTLGVFLSFGILGGKKSTLAIVVYVILGAIGLPVFASFSGGLGILLGINGGFIWGFVLATLAMWLLQTLLNKSKLLPLIMLVGLLVCYTCGTAWYMIYCASSGTAVGLTAALTLCVLPYVIPDLLKLGLSLIIIRRIKGASKQ